MKNKILFAAMAILLLAAACNKGGNKTPDKPEAQKSDAEKSAKAHGSFKDLIAMGKPQKCDATFDTKGNASSGIIYTAGGKMRGDFSSQVDGKTMQMHMIVKDQTSYNWVEGMGTTMGFKTSLNTSNSAKNT